MEFRLTYAGRLLSANKERSLHVHAIRKEFHKQLKSLWNEHPVLGRGYATTSVMGTTIMNETFNEEGFCWKPIVTENNGLICKLDILLLRKGQPGKTLYDIDNRLKTVFDALRMAQNAQELGDKTDGGKQTPGPDENPFYVLLKDDSLITHVAVTSDMLLEPVKDVKLEESARLVINVSVRPYDTSATNVEFAS